MSGIIKKYDIVVIGSGIAGMSLLRNFINKNYSLKYWENFINEKNT